MDRSSDVPTACDRCDDPTILCSLRIPTVVLCKRHLVDLGASISRDRPTSDRLHRGEVELRPGVDTFTHVVTCSGFAGNVRQLYAGTDVTPT